MCERRGKSPLLTKETLRLSQQSAEWVGQEGLSESFQESLKPY